MNTEHKKKYFQKCLQKYYLFLGLTIFFSFILACKTAEKVPEGSYLLTKNTLKYTDKKRHSDALETYILQKPNKSIIPFFSPRLWFYNMINPKYDEILNDYMTYPDEMRNQKLRDSLYVIHQQPELVGRSLWVQRLLRNFGNPPVILDQSKTITSSENLEKRLVYRGYWDAKVEFEEKLNPKDKKAEVVYKITQNQPTYIKNYQYYIPDYQIRNIYEWTKNKSLVRAGKILDQTTLESEISRISENMKENGFYKFNQSGEEVFFTVDTLKGREEISLVLEIKKDTPYQKTKIGKVEVIVKDPTTNEPLKKDSLRGIVFQKPNERFKTSALWRAIVLSPGEVYHQKRLDLTRRNIQQMNNFTFTTELESKNDSILDVKYTLIPMDKYAYRTSMDLTYSQMLSLGISPGVDFTTRNIFGGGENLTNSISATFGRVTDTKDTEKRLWASEISAQMNFTFPRLMLPFPSYKLIPKRYSPSTHLTMGASVQNNLGLGRLNINAGLTYFANVNDIVSHKLTLFNTQFSFTRNKERYYDFFPKDREIRDTEFQNYSPTWYQNFNNGLISSNDLIRKILLDNQYINSLSGEKLEHHNLFLQSLINQNRQTQDVMISSILYQFVYNEIGKKNFSHPFYFSANVESSGLLLGLFSKKYQNDEFGFTTGYKTMFGVPYSQFVKFDFDVRKYLQLRANQTLVFRQFIGIGLPYGNSSTMPFVRSYFNGGANDIRAWRIYGGLGPSDLQLDEKVRAYMMENLKLTTNVEYRIPFNTMFEGAAFVDAGNIWSLNKNNPATQFKFNKFLSQMGVGAGLGIRMHIAYITFRVDAAYKVYDPNEKYGQRWVIGKWKPLQPVLNFAFGYPF